jgi:ribonuclease-3
VASEASAAGLVELLEAAPDALRAQALTHAAWSTADAPSYERLEFVGDAVLGLAVADELTRRHPDAPEGRLAPWKAHAISGASCARVGADLGLDARFAGVAADAGGAPEIRASRRVLAAVTEAVIGAVFLAHGWEPARAAVVEAFREVLDEAETEARDPKTALQEHLQRQGRSLEYVPMRESGPPHRRRFEVAARIDGAVLGSGAGRTRKAAEAAAAAAALQALLGDEGAR